MKDEYITKDIYESIKKNWKKIAIITITVGIISSLASLLMPNWYKASIVMLPPQKSTDAFGAMRLFGNMGIGNLLSGDEDHDRLISILNSRSLLEALARKFKLQDRYECENLEETIETLEDNLTVETGKELQIKVSIWDKNQEEVAVIANYIAVCLDSINIHLSTSKAKFNREFIGSRMNSVLDSLALLEAEIALFMESKGILSIEDQVSIGVEKAADLKYQIMMKEIELTIAKNTYDAENRIIQQLESEIKTYKQKYGEFYQDDETDKLILNFNAVPALGLEYSRFERQVKYYVKVLEYLAPQYESAKIEEARNTPMNQVLDFAIRPEKKDKPKRARIVIVITLIAFFISSYYSYSKYKLNG